MSCTVFLKDKDLKPENIKKGVKIFKIVGTYEGDGGTVVLQDKTADSSTSSQVITYDADYDGLSSVTVNPYVLDSKTIDASTVEQVVTSDADGLSSVTVNAARLQNRTVDPSTVQVDVAITSNFYYGLHQVTVNPVTSSIDSNIVAGNIKDGVTILGVTGNYSGSGTSTDSWYVKVRKGEITDVSAYSLDELASYSNGNAYLLAYSNITTCPQLNSSTLAESNLFATFKECRSFDASAKFDASITNIGNYAFSNTFEISNIKDVSIYIADNLNDKSYIFDNTFAIADIGDVYIKVNGIVDYDEHSNPIYGMKGADHPFDSTFIGAGNGNVTIDVPNCVSTDEMLHKAFVGCSLNSVTITTSRVLDPNLRNFMPYTFQLAYINNLSIPNLSEGYDNLFYNACESASINNLNVHPYVLSVYNGSETSKFAYVADILNLTLTADATDNIYLEYCRNISAESVLNILSHLDLTVSGKDVYFYRNGLTVTDDAQGSIQTAYNAATAAGWTIYSLTIVPAS